MTWVLQDLRETMKNTTTEKYHQSTGSGREFIQNDKLMAKFRLPYPKAVSTRLWNCADSGGR